MRILVAEDETALREALVEGLRRRGHEAAGAADGTAARAGMAGDAPPDLLVTDLRLGDASGLDLVAEARARTPPIEVIVMTGFGTVASAVEAMRRGARAYLQKPFEREELLLHVRDVEETVRLRALASRGGRGDLVGGSAAMRRAYAEIDAAAASDAPVLVVGETGTGKELAARALHDLSAMRGGPFVAVNLGALPRDLVEGELFGHERGAFTGAHQRKRGRFSLAKGGTLLLDEVDSLPLDLQPKLLRAIETREVWPLGAERGERLDVRIVAATNARLEERVKAGAFREDLFYRLAVMRVVMPPLRDRPEDVPGIVRALLDRAAARAEAAPAAITAEALAALMIRAWPGNVRELANALERARARSAGGRIEAAHLDAATGAGPFDLPFKEAKARAAEAWSKRTIHAALTACDGNVSETARRLRMGRTALIRLISRYKIKV